MVSKAPVKGIDLTVEELAALRFSALESRHSPATRRSGSLAGKPPGSGSDLREIRPYLPGDNPRHIDPAATARSGRLHVRSFHEDRDDATLLVFDMRPFMFWGTHGGLRSVRAAKKLVLEGWHAVIRGGAVGAAFINSASTTYPLAANETHFLKLLHLVVAEHNRNRTKPVLPSAVDVSLDHLAHLAPTGAKLHLATAVEGVLQESALLRLSKRRDFTIHLVLDKAETAPPLQRLAVTNGQTTGLGKLTAFNPEPLIEQIDRTGTKVEKVLDDVA